jgi:iron-sulfur cluster assembly protein
MTIKISKTAIAEIARMQTIRAYQQQANGSGVDHKFRIGFAIGGCESFYYTINLTDIIKETDRVYTVAGISVLIDLQQAPYLEHLKLDYSEDLMGGGFQFKNPLATNVCGCGNSFAIAHSESERWQLPT